LGARTSKKNSERVGVQFDIAVRVADLKFIVRADTDAGNENFPDTPTRRA